MISMNSAICCSFLIQVQSLAALDTNATVSKNHDTENSNVKQGWTAQPDGRGTLDIIWSCGITMFLCSWSILCMNMPGPKDSRSQILRRKLALTALGLLCPEVIFEGALGQWLSARQSVRDLNSPSFGETQDNDKWYKNVFTRGKQTGTGRVQERWPLKDAYWKVKAGFILPKTDKLP